LLEIIGLYQRMAVASMAPPTRHATCIQLVR